MPELTGAELVVRITDYLEGTMTPDEVHRVRTHLSAWDGCTARDVGGRAPRTRRVPGRSSLKT